MPSTADPVGDLAEDLGERRVLVREFLGAGADGRGKQQLAARRRPQAVRRLAGAALVRDPERPDLLHGVTEELDAQRVLFCRREHVEQPAADRELAALGDDLDPRVADLHQPRDHVVRVGVLSLDKPHRLKVAEPGHDRLQHGYGSARRRP